MASGIYIPLLMGSTIVFPFFFPETLTTLKSLEAYKCNIMRGTPTQYVDILNHPERAKFNINLESIVVGGKLFFVIHSIFTYT